MTKEQLKRLVMRSDSNTLFAQRMRQALGLPTIVQAQAASGGQRRPAHHGRVKYRTRKPSKRQLKECRQQRHGVRL